MYPLQMSRISKFRFLLVGFGLLFFIGCCDHEEEAPNNVLQALLRNPVTTYTDSVGSEIDMVYVRTLYDTLDHPDGNCAYDVRHNYVPIAEFQVTPIGKTFGYRDLQDWLWLIGFGAQVYSGLPEVDTIIQGQQYENCLIAYSSDSLGSMLFSLDYGLIAFEYNNEYRWERVLD